MILFICVCVFVGSFFLPIEKEIPENKMGLNKIVKINNSNLFQNYCASCHGSMGEGNGPSAITLSKLPPNFLNKNAKFINGWNKTGLLKTLNEGIPGSQMPQFNYLPEEAKEDLVNSLLQLR